VKRPSKSYLQKRDVLGETIHTAFRKGTDAPQSVKIWNAISNMDPEEWVRVLDWILWALGYSGYRLIERRKK
jgi:hypothetical protein